jgi:hypothetical protein
MFGSILAFFMRPQVLAVIGLVIGAGLIVGFFHHRGVVDGREQERKRFAPIVKQLETDRTLLLARLNTTRESLTNLTEATERQTKAVEKLGRDSARKVAQAQRERDAWRVQAKRYQTRAASLAAYQPKGDTEAERVMDVDREFVAQLQGRGQ